MASKVTMVGGVIINATTFVGGSYLEKYEEIKRHDLAVFLTKREKRINYSQKMRSLYAIVDLEGGERRATDPIYSLKVYNIEKSIASFSL